MRGPGLFTRKEVWLPTLRGWLVIALVSVSVAYAGSRSVYTFLAVNRPVGGGLLVVEGWVPTHALNAAIATFRGGGYVSLVTTGGPLQSALRDRGISSYAELAADYLRARGLSEAEIVAVPSPSSPRDRTYQAALALRRWMERSSVAVDRLDVLSYGPHARRSWILHRRVLGEDLRIGILSVAPVQYDPRSWWTASEGVKAVAGEMLGLAWMVCCFRATPRATEAGIGVTIYSDYPRSDSYYRLRRFGGNSFHIAPHPDASVTCTGRTDTEVVPKPGIWYRFRYQGFAERSGTRLRARVWREDEEEPSRWQVDCVDGAAHRVQGSPGLWAMGPGVKVWDDLGVVPLPGQAATSVGSTRRDHEAEPGYDESFQSYPHDADPDGWLDTGALNSLEVAPDLFRTILIDENAAAFGTSSLESNIHSHLQVPGSADWSSYEFRGRMAILEATPKLVSE